MISRGTGLRRCLDRVLARRGGHRYIVISHAREAQLLCVCADVDSGALVAVALFAALVPVTKCDRCKGRENRRFSLARD